MTNNEYMNYELIAKALFETYENIYDVNLETSSFFSFHESESYHSLKLEKKGDDFFEELQQGIKRVIVDEDQEYVVRMLSREKLIEGLKKNKIYSFIYRINQNDKEVYHQLRATLQPMEDGLHAFIGIKNIDDTFRQEEEHLKQLSFLKQKENNHMQAVLDTAAAYMEIDLTKNEVLVKSDDTLDKNNRFIKKIPSTEEISSYDEMHEWICNNLIVKNKKKYQETGNRENLLNLFKKGSRRASVFFSVYTKEGGTQPCREVFFLYKEKETGDIKAFCVIYDLTETQKMEQEKEILEYELKMSRIRNFTSQMQPHFLYNTLGSIQEVMLIDPSYAAKLLNDFAIHLRSCIRAMAKDEPLPFSQELENVKAYINIEKMRLGEKLKVVYDIRSEDFKILPLTVQPLVENAIRHGIYQRGVKGGQLSISTSEDDDKWLIEVKDDGVGFDTKVLDREDEIIDSTGLKNIMFRLEKVMKAKLQIESKPNIGTTVKIMIPKGER